jgi:hypothetical protein
MDSQQKMAVLNIVAMNTHFSKMVQVPVNPNDKKHMVLRLVAMQAQLHGNYAQVRRALPSMRIESGLRRMENDLVIFRAISARRSAHRAAWCAEQQRLWLSEVTIIRNAFFQTLLIPITLVNWRVV